MKHAIASTTHCGVAVRALSTVSTTLNSHYFTPWNIFIIQWFEFLHDCVQNRFHSFDQQVWLCEAALNLEHFRLLSPGVTSPTRVGSGRTAETSRAYVIPSDPPASPQGVYLAYTPTPKPEVRFFSTSMAKAIVANPREKRAASVNYITVFMMNTASKLLNIYTFAALEYLRGNTWACESAHGTFSLDRIN